MLPELPPLVERLRAALPNLDGVWLVGGTVRDILLHRAIHDVDFVLDGDGVAAARTVARHFGGAAYPLDEARGVGRALIDHDGERFTADFARLRGPSLEADLLARDFTINALAVPMTGDPEVIDVLGGLAHLRRKQLVACTPAALRDDPVRAIRAVRLGAQLGFLLDRSTRALVREAASLLNRVSAERIRDEFVRCLGGARPAAAVRGLEWTGLLAEIAPELLRLRGVEQSPPHQLDVWEHTLATVTRLDEVFSLLKPVHDLEAAADLTSGWVSVKLGRWRLPISARLQTELSPDRPRRWIVMLAALLHDIGKPATQTIDEDGRVRFLGHEAVGAHLATAFLERLRFSNTERDFVRVFIREHMRPRALTREHGDAINRRAMYRLFRDLGDTAPEVILFSLADYLGKSAGAPPDQQEWSTHVAGCGVLLSAYFDQADQVVRPPALISGDDLQHELGLKPGPALGRLLDAVREAQAAGEVTTREQALALATQLAA